MSDTFACAHCGGTFDKAWSDEEALTEADALWGDDLVDPVVVCQDCFDAMTAWKPIAGYRIEMQNDPWKV